MDFTALFVDVDDFWQTIEQKYQQHLIAQRLRQREMTMSISEMMTIVIAFQTSHDRTFKHFYNDLQRHHRHDFPNLISYARFVRCLPRMTLPLFGHTGRQ